MSAPVDVMSDDESERVNHTDRQKRKLEDMEEEPIGEQFPPEGDCELNGWNFQKILNRKDINLHVVLKSYLPYFKETAPEVSDETVPDAVMQYLEASPQCEELLDVLSDTSRSDAVINATLKILTTILIRLAEDPRQHRATALRVVRQLIRSHFEVLMKFLNVSKYGPRTVLRLFAVIVTLGHQCAQELLGTFNIGAPHLQKLGQIRKGKEEEDPRTHFVKFAMSLFISDSNEIIKKAIKCKEFCHTIFHDLIQDKAATVHFILTTLRDRVVKNSSILRKTKRLLFSSATLGQIAELYTWGDMLKSAKDPGISKLAHNFLQLVCCSPKHGICHRDDSYGLDGKVVNTTLLTFVSHLKTTSTLKHPLMGDLVVSIFKTCPDLLTPYLRERGAKFTPRPYPDWLNNIMLFEKIYTGYPDMSPNLLQKQRTMALERMLDIVMVTALPPIFTREQYLNNFKGLSLPVHFGLLKVCKMQLQRAVRILKFCESQAEKETSMLSPKEWTEFVTLFKRTCQTAFPDAEFFVGFYEKQQTYLRSENKKQNKEEDYEEWMKSQASTSPDLTIKPEVILLGVLDILRLHQTLFPTCLEGLSLDLNGVFSESLSLTFIKQLSDEDDASIKIVKGLMRFLRGVPPKKILWFKSKKAGSLFSQVLTLLLSSKLVQSEAELLLCKILMETGHFEQEDEAMAWLVTLHDLDQSHRVAVIDFLKRSLIKVVRNPHPFNDMILDAMMTAQLRRESEGDGHSETASTAEVGIAAILDQDEYTIEPAGQEDVAMVTSHVDNSMYCSALLPAALEEFFVLKAKGQSGGIERYISSVISLVINQQRDPVPVSLLVNNCYEKAAEAHKLKLGPGDFRDCLKYCQFWLDRGRQGETEQDMADEEAISLLLEKLEGMSFLEVLQSSFLIGPQVFSKSLIIARLSSLAQSLPSYMILPACKQISFYLQHVDEGRLVFEGVLINFLYIICQRAKQLHGESVKACGLDTSGDQEKSEIIPFQSLAETLFANEAYPDWENYGTRLSFPEKMSDNALVDRCTQRHFLVLLGQFVERSPSAGELQKISDNIFSRIVSGCMQRLTVLEETSSESKWKKYYKKCDWLEHVGLASRVVFQELCCKVLHLVSGFPHCATLLKLFLALPKDLTDLPSSAIDHLVSVVEQRSDCALDDIFCSFVEKSPAVVLKVSTRLLERCLNAEEREDVYSHLAQMLIVHSPVQRIHFAQFCRSPEGREKVKTKLAEEPTTFQPVVNKYVSQQNERRREDEEGQAVVLDIAWDHLLRVYQESDDEEPEGAKMLLGTVCKLMSTGNLQEQAEVVAGNLVKGVGGKKLNFLQTMFGEISTRTDAVNVHDTCLTILKEVLDSCNKSGSGSRAQHFNTLITIVQCVMSMSPDERFAKLWKKFVSSAMKESFQSPDFLRLLKLLVFKLYDGNPRNFEILITLESVFTKVTGHPMFQATMMNNDKEKSPETVEAKGHLVDLILFIAKKDNSCLTTEHVATWLGAYQASGNITDKQLLKLLEVYETNGVDMKAFRPFLWGQAAMDHYTASQAVSPNVLTQPTMREVLDLIDPLKMLQTALKMPLDQPLTGQEVMSDASESSLYDPSFMLALFSSLLEPECLVDCLRFIECNGLFLTVVSLSSYYENTRRIACYILAQFEQHLEGARFRGRREISHLLTCLKNTVPEPGARLPCITTTFVGKAFKQMLNPGGPIFEHILQFISIEPKLPLNLVPAFNSLFLAKGQEHEVKRACILNLLEDGLRDHSDFIICVRNNVWSLLMTLARSPHCSKEDQIKIMAIITKASSIPHAALSLVSNHSLLTTTISGCTCDEEGVTLTLEVIEGVNRSICDLWRKGPSPELTRVFVKTCKAVYVNCLTMLKGMITPSPTILGRVLMLLQKSFQQLEEISQGAEESPLSCGQILTTTSFGDIMSVYAKTTHDPGLPTLSDKTTDVIDCKKRSTHDSEEQGRWIEEDLNQKTADALYYLIFYWLKYSLHFESTNQNTAHKQSDISNSKGQANGQMGDQPLLMAAVLWSLNHFVRRKGYVASPRLSELLAAISATLAANQSQAENFAQLLKEGGKAKSVLSIYHLLNDAPSNSCLDNKEREAIVRSSNQILLLLSKFVRVRKPFKNHLKEWSRTARDVDASFDQERLSVLLQEIWGGESRPQMYEQLPST